MTTMTQAKMEQLKNGLTPLEKLLVNLTDGAKADKFSNEIADKLVNFMDDEAALNYHGATVNGFKCYMLQVFRNLNKIAYAMGFDEEATLKVLAYIDDFSKDIA